MRARFHILLVEDNKADVFLMREALEAADVCANLQVVSDGEKAVRFIDNVDNMDEEGADGTGSCPCLVLLDLNLPKKPGIEVLRHLRRSRRCANSLVLVVSSSDSEKDKAEAANMGANGYFRKPSDYEAYIRIGETVKALLLGQSQRPPTTRAEQK